MNKTLLAILGLVLATIACQAIGIEAGDISITSPEVGTKNHDEFDGEYSLIPVTVQSTFETSKVARVYMNGVFISECLLAPNTATNCIPVPITEPGVHTIRIDVEKNGKVETASVDYEWTPFSSIDKIALKAANAFGSTNPTAGYGIIAAFIILAGMIFGLWVGKGSAQAAAVSVIAGLLALTIMLFSAGSAGGAYIVGSGTILLILAVIVATVIMNQNSVVIDHTTHSGDHTRIEAKSGNGRSEMQQKALGAARDLIESIDNQQAKRLTSPKPHVIDYDE